ncbi:nucleolus and neural progenitor protein [Odontesthes bonariensis]|uniref:nucleolus and neural progenitor protein n=1 Tax=Odontesthes bonariensis TaxID=219752 RepID=UPI003F5877B6
MAGEPWNRVNIPFPSAASTVDIQFSTQRVANVKTMSVEIEKVLILLRSEIFQTEIRVLYELLYILNNSFRGNKTFKGLQQVEQCINRLKIMKLDAALQELADLCPNKIQRALSIKRGHGHVPSQPMLEWTCLKLLGAAQLLSCTLTRCSRAFTLSKQQMKWEEFVILNVVITSMLSRLWVIFRGMLVSLSTLYLRLLELLRDVAHAQPMPYLTDISLPANIAQFLGPYAFILKKHPAHDPTAKHQKVKRDRRRKASVKVINKKEQKWKMKEDLGVSVERSLPIEADVKPLFKIVKKVKSIPEESHKSHKKQKFKKQVREAQTFANMSAHLEERIVWCRSQRMRKEKRLLSFLRLKCQKMKNLETAGYNVRRKLQSFRREVCSVSSPEGSVPKTFLSPVATRRKARLRSRVQSLRRRMVSSRVRTGVKRRGPVGKQKETELSAAGVLTDDQQRKAAHNVTPQMSDFDTHDDIDDIFASVGL